MIEEVGGSVTFTGVSLNLFALLVSKRLSIGMRVPLFAVSRPLIGYNPRGMRAPGGPSG
jgi:hypothetical protein